jgi:hypothetical protein
MPEFGQVFSTTVKVWLSLLLIGAVVVSLAGLGGYFAYQSYYVSHVVRNGFCSSLTMSSDIPTTDILYYLREARLASRTKKDASLIKIWAQFIAASSAEVQTRPTLNEEMAEMAADNPSACFNLEGLEKKVCVENLRTRIDTQASLDISRAQAEKDNVSEMQALLPLVEREYGAVCGNPEGMKGLDELRQQLISLSSSSSAELAHATAFAAKLQDVEKQQDANDKAQAAARAAAWAAGAPARAAEARRLKYQEDYRTCEANHEGSDKNYTECQAILKESGYSLLDLFQ